MTPLHRAVVALGANLGARDETLVRAFEHLSRCGTVLRRSRLYETAPVGPPQPPYLNAVALLDTALDPFALLRALLDVERAFGRERRERWGPRTLDLDLIAYDDLVLDSAALRLPHPEAARRAFVLVPLCEIAPEWRFPNGRLASELLGALPSESIADVVPYAPHD